MIDSINDTLRKMQENNVAMFDELRNRLEEEESRRRHVEAELQAKLVSLETLTSESLEHQFATFSSSIMEAMKSLIDDSTRTISNMRVPYFTAEKSSLPPPILTPTQVANSALMNSGVLDGTGAEIRKGKNPDPNEGPYHTPPSRRARNFTPTTIRQPEIPVVDTEDMQYSDTLGEHTGRGSTPDVRDTRNRQLRVANELDRPLGGLDPNMFDNFDQVQGDDYSLEQERIDLEMNVYHGDLSASSTAQSLSPRKLAPDTQFTSTMYTASPISPQVAPLQTRIPVQSISSHSPSTAQSPRPQQMAQHLDSRFVTPKHQMAPNSACQDSSITEFDPLSQSQVPVPSTFRKLRKAADPPKNASTPTTVEKKVCTTDLNEEEKAEPDASDTTDAYKTPRRRTSGRLHTASTIRRKLWSTGDAEEENCLSDSEKTGKETAQDSTENLVSGTMLLRSERKKRGREGEMAEIGDKAADAGIEHPAPRTASTKRRLRSLRKPRLALSEPVSRVPTKSFTTGGFDMDPESQVDAQEEGENEMGGNDHFAGEPFDSEDGNGQPGIRPDAVGDIEHGCVVPSLDAVVVDPMHGIEPPPSTLLLSGRRKRRQETMESTTGPTATELANAAYASPAKKDSPRKGIKDPAALPLINVQDMSPERRKLAAKSLDAANKILASLVKPNSAPATILRGEGGLETGKRPLLLRTPERRVQSEDNLSNRRNKEVWSNRSIHHVRRDLTKDLEHALVPSSGSASTSTDESNTSSSSTSSRSSRNGDLMSDASIASRRIKRVPTVLDSPGKAELTQDTTNLDMSLTIQSWCSEWTVDQGKIGKKSEIEKGTIDRSERAPQVDLANPATKKKRSSTMDASNQITPKLSAPALKYSSLRPRQATDSENGGKEWLEAESHVEGGTIEPAGRHYEHAPLSRTLFGGSQFQAFVHNLQEAAKRAPVLSSALTAEREAGFDDARKRSVYGQQRGGVRSGQRLQLRPGATKLGGGLFRRQNLLQAANTGTWEYAINSGMVSGEKISLGEALFGKEVAEMNRKLDHEASKDLYMRREKVGKVPRREEIGSDGGLGNPGDGGENRPNDAAVQASMLPPSSMERHSKQQQLLRHNSRSFLSSVMSDDDPIQSLSDSFHTHPSQLLRYSPVSPQLKERRAHGGGIEETEELQKHNVESENGATPAIASVEGINNGSSKRHSLEQLSSAAFGITHDYNTPVRAVASKGAEDADAYRDSIEKNTLSRPHGVVDNTEEGMQPEQDKTQVLFQDGKNNSAATDSIKDTQEGPESSACLVNPESQKKPSVSHTDIVSSSSRTIAAPFSPSIHTNGSMYTEHNPRSQDAASLSPSAVSTSSRKRRSVVSSQFLSQIDTDEDEGRLRALRQKLGILD